MKKIPGKLNEVTFVEKGREGAESRQMASCIFMHACFFFSFSSVCVCYGCLKYYCSRLCSQLLSSLSILNKSERVVCDVFPGNERDSKPKVVG